MDKLVIEYANNLVESLIRLKDSHKAELTLEEIDAINDACNIIDHNIKRLNTI